MNILFALIVVTCFCIIIACVNWVDEQRRELRLERMLVEGMRKATKDFRAAADKEWDECVRLARIGDQLRIRAMDLIIDPNAHYPSAVLTETPEGHLLQLSRNKVYISIDVDHSRQKMVGFISDRATTGRMLSMPLSTPEDFNIFLHTGLAMLYAKDATIPTTARVLTDPSPTQEMH